MLLAGPELTPVRPFFDDMNIRKIEPDDLAAVVGLMREFAAYEHLEDYLEVTVEKLEAAMFAAGSYVQGLIAQDNGRSVGYALFYPNFSSFRGQKGLYLEDIYISDECRGTGLGKEIIREICRTAATQGAERIDFMVLDWNTSAIDFYFHLGAVRNDEERHFKFSDEAFRELAK